MTELSSVAAADRFRLIQDALRLRDQQRTDQQNSIQQNFSQRLQQQQDVTIDARLAERRIQDRRDIVELERAQQDVARDQQVTLDRINNDAAFVLRRDDVETSSDGVRIRRDLNEAVLLQDIADDSNNLNELRTLDQRNQDAQAQLIERNARLEERRDQEQADAIRQERQLQRSIERIESSANNSQTGAELPRGGIVDVAG